MDEPSQEQTGTRSSSGTHRLLSAIISFSLIAALVSGLGVHLLSRPSVKHFTNYIDAWRAAGGRPGAVTPALLTTANEISVATGRRLRRGGKSLVPRWWAYGAPPASIDSLLSHYQPITRSQAMQLGLPAPANFHEWPDNLRSQAARAGHQDYRFALSIESSECLAATPGAKRVYVWPCPPSPPNPMKQGAVK